MSARVVWPEGKRFAFTVFDDADYDRLHNVKPVYDFLAEIGMRTTKSVWPLAAQRKAPLAGLSLEDAEYLDWIRTLQGQGFEIGFHGARCHSSERTDVAQSLDRFREQLGHDPVTMSNHYQNADSIYWGSARLNGWPRIVYQLVNVRRPLAATGHVEGDAHFWGDLCRERVRYVRNFVFREIDTLSVCPEMPYRDPAMPFVNAWYASAEGGDLASFNAMVTEANQDRLVESGGACIMYTHFAKSFFAEGKLDDRFVALMRRLAALGGWFVPVGTLLDYLAAQRGGVRDLTKAQRSRLQRRWLWAKLRHGSS